MGGAAEVGNSPELGNCLSAHAPCVLGPNRRAAADAIFGKMGGTISEMYFAYGDSDGLAIVDFPSDIDATAALLTVSASGAFAKTKTTVLMELEDSVKSMQIAKEVMDSYAKPAS